MSKSWSQQHRDLTVTGGTISNWSTLSATLFTESLGHTIQYFPVRDIHYKTLHQWGNQNWVMEQVLDQYTTSMKDKVSESERDVSPGKYIGTW